MRLGGRWNEYKAVMRKLLEIRTVFKHKLTLTIEVKRKYFVATGVAIY